MDQIKFQTGLHVEPVVVEDTKLGTIIDKLLTAARREPQGPGRRGDGRRTHRGGRRRSRSTHQQVEIDDAPVVKYIQKILLDAINSGASDIHFEPYEKVYRIRYRMDGELYEIATPPLAIKEKIASRIKVISQAGHLGEARAAGRAHEAGAVQDPRHRLPRQHACPRCSARSWCCGSWTPPARRSGIEALGYEPEQKEALLSAISRPYGMMLVTGPTGSGKTVSLYTCLNILNQPGINISTAEDPAEINLPGINQVNVNDKAGLTFAAALKAFLRQDPGRDHGR